MDDQATPALPQSGAARAFEDLRGEVSLLRRAIEGLAAERRDQPDYGPTLEALATSNEQLRDWARQVSERPAVRLTPLQIGEQIAQSVTSLRAQDQRQLAVAHEQLASALSEVGTLSATARTASKQARREKIIGSLSFVAGLVLFAIVEQVELVWR